MNGTTLYPNYMMFYYKEKKTEIIKLSFPLFRVMGLLLEHMFPEARL